MSAHDTIAELAEIALANADRVACAALTLRVIRLAQETESLNRGRMEWNE